LIKFVLRVRCKNAGTARKLEAVLSPDNRAIPSDQRFAMTAVSRSVVLKVESERARSGFNTVRSVLRDVALFREIWLISREKSG
jgi:hypothetical protein